MPKLGPRWEPTFGGQVGLKHVSCLPELQSPRLMHLTRL